MFATTPTFTLLLELPIFFLNGVGVAAAFAVCPEENNLNNMSVN